MDSRIKKIENPSYTVSSSWKNDVPGGDNAHEYISYGGKMKTGTCANTGTIEYLDHNHQS